jgi:hypothetical protein
MRISRLSYNCDFRMMARMENLLDWLRSQLEATGVPQATLAQHLNLSTDKMSKVMTGVRRITAEEAFAAMEFFREAGAAPAPGMSESPAPWRGSPDGRSAQSIAAAIFPACKKPEALQMKQDVSAFGVLRGDVVFFDMGRSAAPGNLVILQGDGENGEGITELARWHPPVAITRATLEGAAPISDMDPLHRVLYPVLGILRLIPA